MLWGCLSMTKTKRFGTLVLRVYTKGTQTHTRVRVWPKQVWYPGIDPSRYCTLIPALNAPLQSAFTLEVPGTYETWVWLKQAGLVPGYPRVYWNTLLSTHHAVALRSTRAMLYSAPALPNCCIAGCNMLKNEDGLTWVASLAGVGRAGWGSTWTPFHPWRLSRETARCRCLKTKQNKDRAQVATSLTQWSILKFMLHIVGW